MSVMSAIDVYAGLVLKATVPETILFARIGV